MERARQAAQATRTQPVPTPAPASAPAVVSAVSARTPAHAAGASTPPPRHASPVAAPTPPSAASARRSSDPHARTVSPGPTTGRASGPETAEPPAVSGAQRAIGATLGRPRPRGRTVAVMAVLAALAIVLVPVGVARLYSATSGTSAGHTGAAGAVLPGNAPLETVMEIAGRVGSVPVVSLYGPLAPVDGLSTDLLIEGEGHKLAEGEAILLSVSTFSGDDGTNTTGTATGTRIYRGVLDTTVLGEALTASVEGTTEGSRIVLRAPVTDDSGVTSTEITVVDVLPTTAIGDAIAAPGGTPVVTAHDDETVSLSVAGLAPPTRSTVAVLIKGSGQQVSSDDVVIARYAIVNWSGGAEQSNTYGASVVPVTIDMTDTLAGISQHLVDVTVGSRVVLSLPADQGTGTDAVAVVIDVLAIADDGVVTDVNSTAAPEADVPAIQVTPSSTP